MLKRPVKKNGSPQPPAWVVEAQLPSQNLNIYQTNLPVFIERCIFPMWFNLNKIFASDAWAEMSLKELEWA